MKTSLVISGGGCKGAFAVGIISHLYDAFGADNWFYMTTGTSTGALIAPFVSLMSADSPYRDEAYKALLDTYTTVYTKNILKKKSYLGMIFKWDFTSLYSTKPLEKLIRKTLKPEWFEWLKKYKANKCYVCYVNYNSYKKVYVSPGDVDYGGFVKSMLASATVPIFMNPTYINGQVCYDGGVRDLLPFDVVFKSDKIIPIFLNPEKTTPPKSDYSNFIEIIQGTLELLLNEVGKNDYLIAGLNNKNIIPIYPDHVLTTDSLEFHPYKMKMMLRHGYNKSMQLFKKNPFIKVQNEVA